jgi:heat shock protein HtpX
VAFYIGSLIHSGCDRLHRLRNTVIRNKKIFVQRDFITMPILLFLGTDLAILVVLTIAMRLLGLDTVLAQQGAGGLDLTGLLIIAGIIGMSGSFISLAMSKWMAKRMIGAQVIDQLTNPTEAWLVDTLSRQARQAGIGRPEVAIYDSPDLNAFAISMNRNSALVAVSTGLLRTMRKGEVEAVLGHEVSHVANGDMVILALRQGVVNTFVFFLI